MIASTDSTEPVEELHWPESIGPAREHLTLILAPTGNDARLTAEFLKASGMMSLCVGDMEELCHMVVEGCGAVVLAEEVMNQPAALKFFSLMQRQPAWSDVPVTLITTGGAAGAERMRRLSALGVLSNVTMLERPFRPATLVSMLTVALRARARQYQVRKLLVEIGQARDAAERAGHAKDDFLAALSHELRTPLNPVLLLATASAEDPSLPKHVREDFDEIARNVTLEARLIDDLLDLTRITQGKLRLDLTTVDAHAAVHAALETTQLEMSDKQLVVELALESDKAQVRADQVRMQQVLWNVLKNAAKFTPVGGRIRIRTEQVGAQLAITIEDNGAGMDKGELSRVFDAFVQGNHANPNSGHRFGGLGLGLAISRRLMDLHEGSIDASSAGVGHGSMFTVKFPLASAESTGMKPAGSSHGARTPIAPLARELLLVEDHQATRTALQRLLEHRGYQVEAVGTLADARAALANHRFELMLCDLGLPDGSGHQLMSELRGRSQIKGIALSGYGREVDLAKSREMGFIAHLTKPISIQGLDAALADATG